MSRLIWSPPTITLLLLLQLLLSLLKQQRSSARQAALNLHKRVKMSPSKSRSQTTTHAPSHPPSSSRVRDQHVTSPAHQSALFPPVSTTPSLTSAVSLLVSELASSSIDDQTLGHDTRADDDDDARNDADAAAADRNEGAAAGTAVPLRLAEFSLSRDADAGNEGGSALLLVTLSSYKLHGYM
jgi:hypothetical protein